MARETDWGRYHAVLPIPFTEAVVRENRRRGLKDQVCGARKMKGKGAREEARGEKLIKILKVVLKGIKRQELDDGRNFFSRTTCKVNTGKKKARHMGGEGPPGFPLIVRGQRGSLRSKKPKKGRVGGRKGELEGWMTAHVTLMKERYN